MLANKSDLTDKNAEILKNIDRKIVQYLKDLEKLREESAFVTAKLTYELGQKGKILGTIYPCEEIV